MREIEFRGKLINSKEWAYGNLVVKKNEVAIITPDNTPLGKYGQVDIETVGQYIGLKDKNGVKIYEGDIVIIEVFNYQEPEWSGEFKVIYSQDLVSFTFDDLEDISNFKTMNTINSYYHYEIEVIGNIYDNPELLEGE